MKKEEWIKQIQDNVPDGAELVLFDHRKNLYDDDGSGSSTGIIREVEIITHTAEEIEDGCLNVSAIHFDNDDYDDAGGCVHEKPQYSGSGDVPFEVARGFCKEFGKDQCIILTWDKKSGSTWVTTYGVGDTNSKQAAIGGNKVKDFLALAREHDEIPDRFKEWEIESVDRFYYHSSRNGSTYKEITYWYEKHTMERKEVVRQAEVFGRDTYSLPDWAKGITEYRKQLNYDN